MQKFLQIFEVRKILEGISVNVHKVIRFLNSSVKKKNLNVRANGPIYQFKNTYKK